MHHMCFEGGSLSSGSPLAPQGPSSGSCFFPEEKLKRSVFSINKKVLHNLTPECMQHIRDDLWLS